MTAVDKLGENTASELLAKKGRPRKYSREKLVDLAIEYIGHEGYETLSLRSLGRHVGVLPSTLYTYFESFDDLVFAVVDKIFPRVTGRGVASAESPRKQVADFMLALREATVLHPGTLVTPIGSAGWRRQIQAYEKLMEMLRGLDQTPYELVVSIETLSSAATFSAHRDRNYGSSDFHAHFVEALEALPVGEGAPLLREAYKSYERQKSNQNRDELFEEWINDLIDRLLPGIDELAE
jgi:AcrR family transcriptional regulator